MPINPWSTSRTDSATATPNAPSQQAQAYTAPSLTAGDAWIKSFGWAPSMTTRTSTVNVPSAQRLQTIPLYARESDPQAPSDEGGLWNKLNVTTVERQSAERRAVNSTGWKTDPGFRTGDRRWADNPRRDPPAEPRVTSRLGQNTYSFFRLFDQFNRTYDGGPPLGSSRRFTGNHFSMADHRRTYPILGMQPPRSRRNTYRLDPPPWDTGIVDMPPQDSNYIPAASITSFEVPAPGRSLRLM